MHRCNSKHWTLKDFSTRAHEISQVPCLVCPQHFAVAHREMQIFSMTPLLVAISVASEVPVQGPGCPAVTAEDRRASAESLPRAASPGLSLRLLTAPGQGYSTGNAGFAFQNQGFVERRG